MRKYIVTGVLAFIIFSCRHSGGMDCSTIYCVPQFNFQFTLTDSKTGENLLSGTNPRYSTNDIGIFTEAGGQGTSVYFQGDTTNNLVSVRTVINYNPVYLRIKNSKDYQLSVTYKQVSCCGFEITTAKLDEQVVCHSCTGVIGLGVE